MKNKKDTRHEARRLALAYIYSIESGSNKANQKIETYTDYLDIKNYKKSLFKQILREYFKAKEELKNYLKEPLKTWTKDQLLDIDLIIIKMAILEGLILESTPIKVAVDEAVELAKEFGTDKSGKFVNGVLAKIIENDN